MTTQNLFDNLQTSLPDELFETLCAGKSFTMKRIVSTGQSTPSNEWYDQEAHEWVLVLQGEAGIVFQDDPGEVTLKAGDYLLIPAKKRHRVAWTSTESPTVWLALHFKD